MIAAVVVLAHAPHAASADQCDEKGLAVTSAIDATFDRRTKSNVIILRKAGLAELSVKCGLIKKENVDVFFAFESPFPAEQLIRQFSVAAAAGLSVKPEHVFGLAKACFPKALRSETEMADVSKHGIDVSCHAFTRDGGASNIRASRTGRGPYD